MCAYACRDDHEHGVRLWNSATGELASTIESSPVYLAISPSHPTASGLLTLMMALEYPHPNSRCRHMIAIVPITYYSAPLNRIQSLLIYISLVPGLTSRCESHDPKVRPSLSASSH